MTYAKQLEDYEEAVMAKRLQVRPCKCSSFVVCCTGTTRLGKLAAVVLEPLGSLQLRPLGHPLGLVRGEACMRGG